MKKFVFATTTLLCAVFAVSGCSSSAPDSPSQSAEATSAAETGNTVEASESSSEEKITLTIGSAMVTEDPEGAVEQEIANRYMAEHPNVTIEFISMPATEVSKRIVTQAASNDLPDMFFVPNDFMSQLYDLEITADLESLLGEEYLAGYNQKLLADSKINGKMMTVPVYASPYAVIYRTDWFEELGLTPPETWDEFLEVSRKLTRDTDGDGAIDKWAFSMVGSRDNSGEQRFILISKSFGADEIYQDNSGSWATDITTDNFKNALAYFTDLYVKEAVVPPGPVEVDYSTSMELFTGEQTGMILSGPHSLGFITKQNPSLEGKLGSFVIPKAESGEHVSISGIGGYTITESCEHKDVAVDYLKFFTNAENALYFGQETGRMPVRTDAAEDPLFSSDLFKGFLAAMDYCAEPESFPAYTELLDLIGEAYSNVLSESASLDDAYQTLSDKTLELIAETSE